MTKLPFAVSIPHGGTDVPEEFQPHVVATAEDCKEDVDHLTREICSVPEQAVHHFLTFATSRTFVDLDRPPTAFGEEHPDGVVKRKTHTGRTVFKTFPADEVVKRVIDRLYHPYHQALKKIADDPAVKLTLDCHSMSPTGLVASPDAHGESRPPICLGHKAGASAPIEMVEALRRIMAEVYQLDEEQIVVDKPFNGGYITRSYGGPGSPFIQIEFSRGFYMADKLGDPNPVLSPSEVKVWSDRFFETLERLAKEPIFR